MILVDSSVWIDFFNGIQNAETDLLDRLMPTGWVLLGDLILAEVLQGFRSEADVQRALSHFQAFEFRDIAGREIALEAAHNHRILRRRGVTVRTTLDTLIATFCIAQNHELLHRDRDFDPFEHHLGLSVVKA
ncbi:MAG TPA: PIN domain nuclease [Candidatus Binataceae bacterium]|nr:PIN domain nuclease [Candidatus Binataceae bacterium]